MNHKKLLHYTLFLIILIGNSLGVSPEFLNNNQKLDKAKTLSNLDLITQPSKIFSYEYNIRLGKNNYYLRNYNQANRYLNMSLKLAKDSLQKANTYYWLGRNSLINNEPEKATHYFAQVLKHNKNIEPEFLFFYGMALYTIEQYDDALNVFLNFESQVKDESQKEELPLFIGASALGKGDFGLAQQYLNQIISQNNKKFFPIPEYLLGMTYYLIEEPENSLDQFIKVKSDTILTLKDRAHLVSGTIYFEDGDITKAINEFEAIINDTIATYSFRQDLSETSKEQAFLRSGIAYYKLKKTRTALARFDSLKQKYPNSQLNEWASYYTAQIYQQSSKFSKAKSEYKQLIAAYPNSPLTENSRYNLGQILYKEQNYIEAAPILDDFLRDFPKSQFRKDALFTLIQSCHKLRDDRKLESYGEKFTKQFPATTEAIEVHYILGEVGINKMDYSYAMKHLGYIKRSILFPYALKRIGDVNLALDSLSQAVQYYNWAEKVCIDSLIDDIRYARELVYTRQGLYESNLDMFRRFLEKYPESRKAVMVQYEIGEYYLQQGNFTQAIIEFDKVKDYNSNSEFAAKAELSKAEAYKVLSQPYQAIECYLRIINELKTTPFIPEVMQSLADLYFSVQSYDSAIVLYNRLLTDFPKSPESELVNIALAKIYYRLGKYNEGAKLLEQFIIRHPHSNHLSIAYLNLFDGYKELGQLVQAEKTIQGMFNKIGKSGDGYFKLGLINILKNKPDSAEINFLQANNFYIREQKRELATLSLFEAGKCAVKTKKWDEAKELFNRCINETQDERLRIQCDEQLKQIP